MRIVAVLIEECHIIEKWWIETSLVLNKAVLFSLEYPFALLHVQINKPELWVKSPKCPCLAHNYLPWFILTEIVFLHAHPQIVYYNCVKFHQHQFERSCVYEMYGQVTMMNKQDDSYFPPLKLLFVEGIIRVFLPDKIETFLLNGYNRTDMYTWLLCINLYRK